MSESVHMEDRAEDRIWWLYGAAYVISVGVLMFLNTSWLEMGDPAWGLTGWRYYWPFWALATGPAVCLVLYDQWRVGGSAKRNFVCAALLFSLLCFVELCFLLSLGWLYVIGGQLLVAAASRAAAWRC
jgi:hypothetical protein